VLDRLGLTHRFDVIADGTTVTNPKPAADVFLWTAERLGVPPAECVVFEDSISGFAAALAGGFKLVALGAGVIDGAYLSLPGLAGARLSDFV